MLFSVMGSWYTQYRPALLYMKAYKQQMHKIQGAEIQAVAQKKIQAENNAHVIHNQLGVTVMFACRVN